MKTPLKFKFPLSTLVQDGDTILTAAEARPELTLRLKTGFVAEVRAMHTTLKGHIPAQATAKAIQGELTNEQNTALETLHGIVARARKTAKLAFPGQDVKLRQEFLVGHSDAQGLADFLQTARIIQAACKTPANLAAMKENGWIEADTTALTNAIADAESADSVQEESKGKGAGATDVRNDTANKLYDGLLKIQNAADLQYPESMCLPVHVTVLNQCLTSPLNEVSPFECRGTAW